MPGTGNTAQKKLNPAKTATPDAGAKFEISVATLVAAILSNNDKIENYHVFTNLKEAYPFDDVVAKVFFKGENTPYAFAMQLKHIGKGETLDAEKYLKGYNKVSDAGGFKTVGDIGIANIHFCYFCIDKVKKADSYTLHQHNLTGDSWRSVLPFSNCHKLALTTDITETNKDFLSNFHLYLNQPDNSKIKENIKIHCKIKDVSGILNFIDRYFEKDILWKRGLRKEVFETELLRIRLSDHIIQPPTNIIQLDGSQSTVWHTITLEHNVTIVAAETNIEKSLYGSCAQAMNRLFNNGFNWDTYKTNPLDSSIENEFKKLFAQGRVRHWIDPPTTLKSLIIELWKCGELPLILRSDDNLPALKDYAHLNKSYIIVTENVATKREECESYQLSVFMQVSDIKCEEARVELLKGILISLQGRKPITLHSIIGHHKELITTLSCSHIIHLMKSRKAYLSKECLHGDHNLLFLIEDPNTTAEYSIDSNNAVGRNIAIRCRPEDIVKCRKQIDGNPKFKNYEIYHCVTSSRHENFSLLEGNKSLVRDFFVDQDGEVVYALRNEPVPIIGSTLKNIQPRYIPRLLCHALVSESLFDSETKGICFFSGNVSYLKENIRQDLMEAPDNIKFDNKNTFIKVKDENVDKYWQKASDLKCPLLHIHVDGTDMYLRRCKNWADLSEHITYNGRKIPEENILKEVTDGITILTGEPGIGKSSLLQSMFKNHVVEKYILFYNLVDYSHVLEKDNWLDFLLERSVNKRYKELLSALLRKKDRAAILLDSFDEVLPTYKEHVLHFIRNLAASNVQIIIASRTIANYILMDNFETRILKVDFLREDDSREYAKNFNLNEKILANIPNEFLQNPLYLNLLKIISENNVNLKNFSKLTLFQSVIEIKMEEYFQRYFSIEHMPNKELHLKPVREQHFHLALVRILGANKVKELLQTEIKNGLIQEFKLGAVLFINEKGYPTFVHETFAEYLTADWIIRNRMEDTAKQIYLELKKQKKLHILDILCEHLELHKAVLTQNEQQIEMYAADRSHLERTDALGRMAIHIAAAYQPRPLWSALNIIICSMHNFKIDVTHFDGLMQWDWVQHLHKKNITAHMMRARISTSIWQAYLSCISQKAQNDSNYINLFHDYKITEIYNVAVRNNSIEMMRNLLFIEDLKYNGMPQASEVDKYYLRNFRKFTALHVACIYGDVAAVRKLTKHEHINATDEFGCTPLFYSVMNPPEVSTDMTKILLKSGSKVDIENYCHQRVLDIAVVSENVHIMKLLLQKYVRNKSSREHMLRLVFFAIEKASNESASRGPKHAFSKRHSEIIELLLENGADVNGRNAFYETPLMLASQYGLLHIVKVLFRKGADINMQFVYGKTALMLASKCGKLDIVKILLENGANVNYAPAYGTTPLMLASEYGKLDMVKFLLENGADVNSVGRDGKTVLMFASQYGKLDIVKILLENGADVNSVGKNGKTVLMFASQYGELDIVKILLENGADVNAARRDGGTPLMLASEYGKLDIVKILLENGADVNAAGRNGGTPLMLAFECRNLDIVKILLENGADVNAAGRDGGTPLILAFECRNLDIVKILLENGADVNAAGRNGGTPLMLASEYGKLDIVKILLENGADVNAARIDGETPLMFASQYGNLDIVKILLENSADANAARIDGKTPLMFASHYGELDILKILLKNDAEVNVTTRDGKTPLMLASQKGSLGIVKILLEQGADVNRATICSKTALMYAFQYNKLDIVKILLEKGASVNDVIINGRTPLACVSEWGRLDILKMLLEKGADVNGATASGETPLMFASQSDKLDIVKMLLENGADVNSATVDSETALMYPFKYNKLDVVKILLENGASVNDVKINGRTLLACASEWGRLDVLKMLLDKGADVNGATTTGATPLMSASLRGESDIAKILLEKGADVNSATTAGATPLILACQYGKLDIVKMLLEKGADVNGATGDSKTALMYAFQSKRIDIVKVLLENSASVNGVIINGRTPLACASEWGRLDVLRMLLEKGADVNGATADGTTPLMFASKDGFLNIVKMLLEKGAGVNSATADGKTPLMIALQEGNLDIVEMLLEQGADVNGATKDGITTLMFASQWDKLDIVKILLEKGADVNAAERYGRTPLMVACQCGKLDIAVTLLENGADINSITTLGDTAVIFAHKAGYMEIVNVLLGFGASTTSFKSSRFSELTARLPSWLRRLFGIKNK